MPIARILNKKVEFHNKQKIRGELKNKYAIFSTQKFVFKEKRNTQSSITGLIWVVIKLEFVTNQCNSLSA